MAEEEEVAEICKAVEEEEAHSWRKSSFHPAEGTGRPEAEGDCSDIQEVRKGGMPSQDN